VAKKWGLKAKGGGWTAQWNLQMRGRRRSRACPRPNEDAGKNTLPIRRGGGETKSSMAFCPRSQPHQVKNRKEKEKEPKKKRGAVQPRSGKTQKTETYYKKKR